MPLAPHVVFQETSKWRSGLDIFASSTELFNQHRTYSIERGLRQTAAVVGALCSKAGYDIVGKDSWCSDIDRVGIVNADLEFLFHRQDKLDTIEAHDTTPKTRRLFADRLSIAVFALVRMLMA